jgi:chemotaxis protein methyltransferase CheR
MLEFSPYELESFRSILQNSTGYKFPKGLEQEFSFRLQRALQQQGYRLGDLLSQLRHQSDQRAIVKTLAPLLPDLLIGETYFWREPDTFEALTRVIMPEIVERKGAFSRLLRVWSAACSTGEEVYSLAITLKHFFKDQDWSWSVMGTDLNEKALDFARRGEYSQYSFRTQTLKYPYCFEALNDARHWRVRNEYRSGIRFQKLNLAANDYPSPVNDTCNYDLIFCRNVFIYFEPEQSQQVVDRLYEALNDGGYLVVSPCEYSTQLFSRFESIQAGPVTFYRRPLRFWALLEPTQSQSLPSVSVPSLLSQDNTDLFRLPEANPDSIRAVPVLNQIAVPDLAPLDKVAPSKEEKAADRSEQLIKQAKVALGQRRWEEALRFCQEAIKVDVLRAESYLLLTGIYQEIGQLEMALEMARKFSYLEPERPEGQFYLASLQQVLGKKRRAIQSYKRLITLLEHRPSTTRLENLPGLSCGELQQLALESLVLLQTTNEN